MEHIKNIIISVFDELENEYLEDIEKCLDIKRMILSST